MRKNSEISTQWKNTNLYFWWLIADWHFFCNFRTSSNLVLYFTCASSRSWKKKYKNYFSNIFTVWKFPKLTVTSLRFYVKSIMRLLESQNYRYMTISASLNFDFTTFLPFSSMKFFYNWVLEPSKLLFLTISNVRVISRKIWVTVKSLHV